MVIQIVSDSKDINLTVDVKNSGSLTVFLVDTVKTFYLFFFLESVLKRKTIIKIIG